MQVILVVRSPQLVSSAVFFMEGLEHSLLQTRPACLSPWSLPHSDLCFHGSHLLMFSCLLQQKLFVNWLVGFLVGLGGIEVGTESYVRVGQFSTADSHPVLSLHKDSCYYIRLSDIHYQDNPSISKPILQFVSLMSPCVKNLVPRVASLKDRTWRGCLGPWPQLFFFNQVCCFCGFI